MPSSLISQSRFLSITSALVAVATLTASGCSDNSCGTMGASLSGLTASNDMVTITYGNLSASPNHDCPDPNAPAGVESLTISGFQVDGDSSGLLTLCVARPDLLAKATQTLGSDVKLVDAGGGVNSCMFTIDRTRPPSGSVKTQGECDNGTNSKGFVLVIDGAFSLTRKCGTTMDSQAVVFAGTVAVARE
jgi:hypothetical protein